MKKNLIIVPSGDNSLHQNWISGDTNFDLVVIYYGDSQEKFKEYKEKSIDCVNKKGHKWFLIYDYIVENQEKISEYDFFWFPDDDLMSNTENLNIFFNLIKENSLWLSQPSLDGYVSYPIELKVANSKLRFTNFVEIICPAMDRNTLTKLIGSFKENESGWGLDYLWPKLLGYPIDKIAIIDTVTVTHTRPVGGNYSGRFKKEPMTELSELFAKYGLSFNQTVISTVKI
jgi:hypothetical protein